MTEISLISSPPPQRRRLLPSLLRNKAGLAGIVIVALIVVTALGAEHLAPLDPLRRNLSLKLLPPAWLEGGNPRYLLGTDSQGRDLLSRIIFGARTSLSVGLAAVALSSLIGLALGLLAGMAGGRVDLLIMRVIDAMLAIPTMLFMLVVALVAGSGLLPLVVVIAATNWVGCARIVRADVLGIREMDYVAAARASGASPLGLILRHILPNILSSFVVVSTLNVGTVILAESSLSFLGFGIQPPEISWGQMLSEGRQYLATSWWVATFPGIAITLTVLGVILLGDWLRDHLDPRLA
ncbi:ABC transporter permease [Bosea sp. TAB14]|jgi:peptide/nickel transport system permease protein|uniref:ABC transporter permease n=1 Tax=Bosea sp. TAB14 TaxID=3237481 RepID=UPI003F91A6CA